MKELTFNEFMELAQKKYYHGGDAFVECWDINTFNEWVAQFGPITENEALDWFDETSQEEFEFFHHWNGPE